MTNTNLLGAYGGHTGDALMFRNKLVNGCMRVWQRATSGAHTGIEAGSYVSADRWKLVGHQAGISYLGATLERSTDVPSGSLYSAKAISTAAGIDDYVVGQIIESMNTFDLVGKPATFSVQMKKLATLSGKTLTMEVGYLNTADTSTTNWLTPTGITIIASRIINSTDFATSWGQYTLTTGVLPAQAANGLVVRLCLRGNDLGSGDLFAFTDAALEAGPNATPFERRPIGVELSMCQRYYERGSTTVFATSESATSIYLAGTANFKVSKRASPGGLTTTDAAGNAGKYSDFNAGTDAMTNNINSVLLLGIDSNTARLRYLYQPGSASKNNLFCFWAADAEL